MFISIRTLEMKGFEEQGENEEGLKGAHSSQLCSQLAIQIDHLTFSWTPSQLHDTFHAQSPDWKNLAINGQVKNSEIFITPINFPLSQRSWPCMNELATKTSFAELVSTFLVRQLRDAILSGHRTVVKRGRKRPGFHFLLQFSTHFPLDHLLPTFSERWREHVKSWVPLQYILKHAHVLTLGQNLESPTVRGAYRWIRTWFLNQGHKAGIFIVLVCSGHSERSPTLPKKSLELQSSDKWQQIGGGGIGNGVFSSL